jgi:hypothetical protein
MGVSIPTMVPPTRGARRACLLPLLMLAPAGCRDRAVTEPVHFDVVVEALADTVTLPGWITVLVTNRSAVPVFNNVCQRDLEHDAPPGRGWNGDYSNSWACGLYGGPPDLRSIEPGASMRDSVYAGRMRYYGPTNYRLVLSLIDASGTPLPPGMSASSIFHVFNADLTAAYRAGR